MNNYLISIAILNYNGLKFLEKTLPSLLDLDYPSYEIIVFDNNSVDESVNFIKKLNNKKVRLIKSSHNNGYSKGKNECVKNSNGRYILLLDNDILITKKNILNDLLNEYNLLEKPAFLGPVLLDIESNLSKYYGVYYSFYGINVHKKQINISNITSGVNLEKNIKIGSFHGGAVFFEKSVWGSLGGYDELQPFMLDDFDIGARSYIFGYNNYLFNNYPLIHLGKSNDLNKKNFAWKFKYYFSGVAISIYKNYKTINLIFYIPIYILYSFFLLFILIIKKKNYYLFDSYIKSIFFFFNNFKSINKERKEIQSNRTVKNDIFLDIKVKIS